MISAELKENLKVCLTNDKHSIMSDVTHSKGGDDTALDPHELLEASLAACTSITVTMYAKRKGWNLENVHTIVKITKEGNENEIERKIDLIGNLDEEQKKRLLEIANKCPMHIFLEHKTVVHTSLL